MYMLIHFDRIDNLFSSSFIQILNTPCIFDIAVYLWPWYIWNHKRKIYISLIGILTKRLLMRKISDGCFLARIRLMLARILISSWESITDKWTHLDDILVGEGLVGFVVLGVLEENLVHVGARILVQLVARTEDNQRNLAIAQYRQFVRFLHHAEFPLVKGHLSYIKERGTYRRWTSARS